MRAKGAAPHASDDLPPTPPPTRCASRAAALEDLDYDDGSYGPVLVRLAWHAAGTYDKATNSGGSNGATMRYPPESNHGANAGLAVARKRLEPIKAKYPGLTYADLWSLAGVVAIQEMGGPVIPWRPGRADFTADKCTPDGRLPDATKKSNHLRDIFGRMGFNDQVGRVRRRKRACVCGVVRACVLGSPPVGCRMRGVHRLPSSRPSHTARAVRWRPTCPPTPQEIVALSGAHALGRCHTNRSGFDGPWTRSPTTFSNDYYVTLLNEKWVPRRWAGPAQWTDSKTGGCRPCPH